MAQDDDTPPPRRRRLEPAVLDSLGIAELDGYLAELRAEIAMVETEIVRKRRHRSAADAFFKPG
jgi:uncharacterized small protein (DUF1192 family)